MFLGDWLDAVVILAIVVLNAALGFFQEYRAEQSMAALKRLAAPVVRVRRDGRVQEISARDLVPGDVVLLETGNVVPADGRLLQSSNLRVQEAALTGESEAIEKDARLSSAPRARSATGATWCIRARSSATATARRSSPPPAWTPSWARSPT